jgi:NAD(P)-dependent dehydrogenase (short-subunit alcohol dehydrogenase family)
MTKTMLITGASRGIGAATAVLAAEQGWHVCINYNSSSEAAAQLVERIEDKNGRATMLRADVSNESEVVSMFQLVDDLLGPLDCLVNNAGILDQQMRVEEMTAARLERVFSTNITGSFLCAREAVKRMSTNLGGKGGTIINLSSAASRLGSPNEFVDYAASKGAIDTMTIGLAREVANEGIRVNAVRPGLIDTDIHASSGEPRRVERMRSGIPMQREGSAEEVANAIIWLASDDSSYSTGSFIDVTGGR